MLLPSQLFSALFLLHHLSSSLTSQRSTVWACSYKLFSSSFPNAIKQWRHKINETQLTAQRVAAKPIFLFFSYLSFLGSRPSLNGREKLNCTTNRFNQKLIQGEMCHHWHVHTFCQNEYIQCVSKGQGPAC